MLDRKPDDIDFKKAKLLTLRATQEYLNTNSKDAGGDRYGQYHGKSGVRRANHVIQCLTFISSDNKPAILAVLLAVFGKPSEGLFGISIGRSSALASMIADAFITGDSEQGMMHQIESIGSPIFSVHSIQAVDNIDVRRTVPGDMASFTYLDKTMVVRVLLQDILNSPAFAEEKTKIEYFVKKLNSVLTSSAPIINLNFFNEFTEPFDKYKTVVTSAFLDMTRLPQEIGANMSAFFSSKDTASVAQLNKKTAEAAKGNLPVNRKK